MSTIMQTEGEKILRPYYDLFVTFYKKALKDWEKIVTEYPDLSARARAIIINDRVRSHTRAYFPADMINEKGGRFFVRINKIAGRYKKLRNSRPSYIPTQTALLLENQQLELGDVLEPLTIVNIGYIPNKTHTDYRFVINCVKGKRILWQKDIDINKALKTIPDISESEIQQEEKRKRVQKKAQ